MAGLSRRDLMAAAAGVMIPSAAFATDPVIPEATIAARKNAPVVPKKVNKLYNLTAGGVKEPNDMQFAPDGKLWVLDQVDPNHVATIDPKTGQVLANVVTDCIHGSGITYGDGAWFLTSTKVREGNPSTLKVDPKTGKTLKKWETPGWGIYGTYTTRVPKPGDLPLASGGHGVKWAGNGQYWMAVPASGRIFLMEGESGKIVRSIPAPVLRTHGLAIDGNYLWSVASDYAQIQKIDQKDGRIVGKIQMDKANDPQVHGLELKDGVLWYCDASKGWFCTLT